MPPAIRKAAQERARPGFVIVGEKEFAAMLRQSSPGKKKWPSGGLQAWGPAGLSHAGIIGTKGVEGKETKLYPSCTLINMQEIILLFECINLPWAVCMRLECEEPGRAKASPVQISLLSKRCLIY